MRTKLLHIILVFGLIIMPAGIISSYGQETAGSPSYDTYDPDAERERERIISSPGENTDPPIIRSSAQPSSKDSISKTPAHRSIKTPVENPKNQNKPKNEDESILSFNFLYYIIQKYKLQDIID